MALSTTTNRVSFSGNGSTTIFSFPYYFLANGDLVVILRVDATAVETTKTITTHYTVSGAGVAAGGSVTMLAAPASGETLIIYRDPAATQGLDLAENDASPAESQEQAHDRIMMIAQRLKDRMDRTVRLTDGFSPTFDLKLPSNLNEALSKIPVTNATGDGWANCDDWPSTEDINDAEANAAAAAASASAASASASAAAASAVTAAAVAAEQTFVAVVYLTFADSPYTVTAAQVGKVFDVDCTGGAVTVNIPSIALVTTLNKAFVFVKRDISVNKVTLDANGTDTIAGAATITLDSQNAGAILVADTGSSPDDWTKLLLGSSGVGGGGAGLEWYFGDSNGPIEAVLSNGLRVLDFGQSPEEQEMFCQLAVPDSYVQGTQIKLIDGKFFSPTTSGNVLFRTETVIFKANIAATSSPTVYTATNAQQAVDGTTNEIVEMSDIDLTSSTGTINSVAVAAGDTLLVKFYRDTSAETSGLADTARLLRSSLQPKFTA